MKIWCVFEEGVIWAAFTKRVDAIEFRHREFVERPDSSGILPKIKAMPVYLELAQAPTTVADALKEALLV